MDESKKCPKCSGEMIKGSMYTQRTGLNIRWFGGKPGLFTNFFNLPNTISYKCEKCGFLENYVETK